MLAMNYVKMQVGFQLPFTRNGSRGGIFELKNFMRKGMNVEGAEAAGGGGTLLHAKNGPGINYQWAATSSTQPLLKWGGIWTEREAHWTAQRAASP